MMSKLGRRRARAVVTAVAVAATTGVLAAGCTGGGDSDGGPRPTGAGSSDTPTVTTAVSVGKVVGRLPQAARDNLADEVGQVVDGWFDAAYLGGDYPRQAADFGDAWPGFTAGAAAEAKRDGDLMSNRDIAAEVDGVEATRKAVRFDVLAVRKKAAGVTAHVRLRFTTTGDLEKTVTVAGRLYLTRTKQGWQVFGYDVTKGGAR